MATRWKSRRIERWQDQSVIIDVILALHARNRQRNVSESDQTLDGGDDELQTSSNFGQTDGRPHSSRETGDGPQSSVTGMTENCAAETADLNSELCQTEWMNSNQRSNVFESL